MKYKFITLFSILLSFTLLSTTDLPMHIRLDDYNYSRLSNRDNDLPFDMQLDKWFPHHSKLFFGNMIYLTTPYFLGARSDFYISRNPQNEFTVILRDTQYTHTDTELTMKTGEIIQLKYLSESDIFDIKPQIAWLTILFRSLGSPVPELMLGAIDDAESWLVIYENDEKNRLIFDSFHDCIRRINSFYEGYVSYFMIDEIRKMNGRLEFFGTLFMLDKLNDKMDFIDVRFHTNRDNVIDLTMFFIYRDRDIDYLEQRYRGMIDE
jgi:hypothetical protein